MDAAELRQRALIWRAIARRPDARDGDIASLCKTTAAVVAALRASDRRPTSAAGKAARGVRERLGLPDIVETMVLTRVD